MNPVYKGTKNVSSAYALSLSGNRIYSIYQCIVVDCVVNKSNHSLHSSFGRWAHTGHSVAGTVYQLLFNLLVPLLSPTARIICRHSPFIWKDEVLLIGREAGDEILSPCPTSPSPPNTLPQSNYASYSFCRLRISLYGIHLYTYLA